MKKLYSLLLLGLLAGCMSPIIESEEIIADMQSSVRILTRSTSEICYPLTLYAFDVSNGTLVASVTQSSALDELSLSLPLGEYYMVALAGVSECTVSANPKISSIVSLPAKGVMAEPLQMGSAGVYVSQNTTVDITLYNQVAAVDLSFYDIPAEATAVSASLSLISSEISFDGTYSGSATASVSLMKQGDVWKAPLFYTFPNSSGKLTLSISVNMPDGVQTFGYTHPTRLLANTPYVFNGNFTSGFSVNGVLSLAGWDEPQQIDFTFGTIQDVEEGSGDESDNDDDLDNTGEIPEVGSLWKGHIVVAHLDEDSESVLMLLLSAAEWIDVASATNEENPDMAADIASVYAEGDLIGWSIPTRDEVRIMCAKLGGQNLSTTNSFLESKEMAPLSVGDDIRYLCDEAVFSYKWDSEGSVSKVGSKRTYHLRLVRRVRMAVE